MCKERDETVAHIVSECQKLAQNEYKIWQHDPISKIIHWELCKKFDIEASDKWYTHTPEKVIETEACKILWDFSIQTDHKLEHNKPDILVIDKVQQAVFIVDIACPFDSRIEKKEAEKIQHYLELKREIKRLWKINEVIIIPIIIGSLGSITKKFTKHLKKMDIHYNIELLQKACLLGTARIIHKVLDT